QTDETGDNHTLDNPNFYNPNFYNPNFYNPNFCNNTLGIPNNKKETQNHFSHTHTKENNIMKDKDFLYLNNKSYDNNLFVAGNNIKSPNENIKKIIELNTTKLVEERNNSLLDINEYNNNSNDLNEYFDNLIENNILSYRKINIKKNKIGTKFIMNKLMYTNVSNNERYRYYLDDNLKVSYINQLRLMIPYISYCLGKIAMSIVFYIFYIRFDISYLKLILTDYKMYFKLFEHKNIIFIVSFSIILGNTIISFFSFIFLSSFCEVLLSTLFIFIKCISEFLFLLLLVYNEVFEIFLRNIKQPDKYASYFFLTFAVIPSFKIIKNIYFFLCALSGRQFIAYIIRPFIKDKNISKLPNFFNLNEYNNNNNNNTHNNNNISQNMNYINEDYYLFHNNDMYTKNIVKGDYKGFISIASLLIYINTKYMHGLASLSTLMLGNNFIKNLRLNYNLRNNHVLLIFINFFTRLSLLLFIYVHYKTNDKLYEYVEYFYYLVTFIFILDFIFKCVYMFISHNLRLCAAYHLELKSMYEDIYYHSQIKKESSKEYLKQLYAKYQTNNFYYYNIPLFSEFL
ncbi:putative membrane protein, partial [Plasmodium reichenowi]